MMKVEQYWRNVGSVLTGVAFAQAIPVLASLVIARLFIPNDFGAYSAWLGIVMVIAVIITGRFEMTLAMLPDGEPRRIGMIATLLTAVLGVGIASVIAAVIYLWFPGVLRSFPKSLIGYALIASFLIACSQIWQSWAAAEGKYRNLSFMRIGFALAVALFQIGLGVWWSSLTVLVIGHTIGALVGVLVSAYVMPLGRLPEHMRRSIQEFWLRYHRFPAISLPADAINTLAANLPLILVASRFGADIAGFLALSMRTLGAPIGLLGKAVLDVFRQQAAKHWREYGHCRHIYNRTFIVLSVASLVVMPVLLWFGSDLFAWVFGEKWRYAGVITVWLLPMFMLRFVASPLSYMFYLAEKQQIDLVWQITLLVMTVSSLLVPDNHKVALQAYGAGYAMLYVIYLCLSYRLAQGKSA